MPGQEQELRLNCRYFGKITDYMPVFKAPEKSAPTGFCQPPDPSGGIIYGAKKVPVQSPLKSNFFFDYNGSF